MCLGSKVEDEGRIGRGRQCLDRTVDGEAIRKVSPVEGHVLAEMADVVQSAARRSAHEDVNAALRGRTSASVTCEPMKPSAPVTSTVRLS